MSRLHCPEEICNSEAFKLEQYFVLLWIVWAVICMAESRLLIYKNQTVTERWCCDYFLALFCIVWPCPSLLDQAGTKNLLLPLLFLLLYLLIIFKLIVITMYCYDRCNRLEIIFSHHSILVLSRAFFSENCDKRLNVGSKRLPLPTLPLNFLRHFSSDCFTS